MKERAISLLLVVCTVFVFFSPRVLAGEVDANSSLSEKSSINFTEDETDISLTNTAESEELSGLPDCDFPYGALQFADEYIPSNVEDDALLMGTSNLSSGVQNIVARAYQQINIEWTALKDVDGYINKNGVRSGIFEKGTRYKGIPYGQPVDSTKYVPWDVSFDTFLNAVSDVTSKFYTTRNGNSDNGSTCPYYSNDCSAFVSYAYDLGKRYTTVDIAGSSKFTKVSGNNIYNAQVGDCLVRSAYDRHIVLITDLVYDSTGKLSKVEISQQTPPQAVKNYKTPDTIISNYINKDYKLLRYNNRDAVRAPNVISQVTSKPGKFSIKSANGKSISSIEVKWEESEGAKSYDLYAKIHGGDYGDKPVAKNIKSTSYTLEKLDGKDLKAANRYWFYVVAKNDAGTRSSSEYAGYTKMPQPTVDRSSDDSYAMIISWDTKPTSVKSYSVQRRKHDEDSYTTIKSGITAMSYTDKGTDLDDGAKYYSHPTGNMELIIAETASSKVA